eukprot:scaffold69812_cov33-Attheya_sp.AAC.2
MDSFAGTSLMKSKTRKSTLPSSFSTGHVGASGADVSFTNAWTTGPRVRLPFFPAQWTGKERPRIRRPVGLLLVETP